MAAHIFAELKWIGINCELVTEYAKDVVWAENYKTLENQIYVFGKQQRRIQVLLDKVDVIITDSPFIMGISYMKEEATPLKDLIVYEFKKLNSLNLFVKRLKTYNPSGRMQTFEEAKEKDTQIKNLLEIHQVPFEDIEGKKESVENVVNKILDLIKT